MMFNINLNFNLKLGKLNILINTKVKNMRILAYGFPQNNQFQQIRIFLLKKINLPGLLH